MASALRRVFGPHGAVSETPHAGEYSRENGATETMKARRQGAPLARVALYCSLQGGARPRILGLPTAKTESHRRVCS